MPAGGPPVELEPRQRQELAMVISVLLDYPREMSHADWELIQGVVQGLPPQVRHLLEEFLEAHQALDFAGRCQHYVHIFDQKRRCCLYLSYYSTGDTRNRGSALLVFKKVLQAVGFQMRRSELPDYLPLLLELYGRSGDQIVSDLLEAHSEAIEVLRLALAQAGSYYETLVRALQTTLRPLDEQKRAAVLKLIKAGPPAEVVGVTSLPFPVLAGHSDGAAGANPSEV